MAKKAKKTGGAAALEDKRKDLRSRIARLKAKLSGDRDAGPLGERDLRHRLKRAQRKLRRLSAEMERKFGVTEKGAPEPPAGQEKKPAEEKPAEAEASAESTEEAEEGS